MRNRLMISAATIALVAGTSLANAQGMNREPGGGTPGGAAMQEHGNTEPSSSAKATRSEQKSPEGSQKQRAEDMQAQKSKSMSTGNETKEGSKDLKAEGRESRDSNTKVEGREGRDSNMNAETKSGMDAKSQTQTTTGQAGAGAKLSTEQRTKITTVIRDQHVAASSNVNFSIAVGTRVPREGVTLHPLPAEVVTIYPEWRGYEFILVRDQILVVDPATLEIVAILEA